MQFIEVKKFEIREGEELHEVVNKVYAALTQHRQRTSKSLMLMGIYKAHIITKDMENGRLFKLEMKRDQEGNVELGETEEVRQVFVAVKSEAAKSADQDVPQSRLDAIEELMDDDASSEILKYESPKENLWKGVLG